MNIAAIRSGVEQPAGFVPTLPTPFAADGTIDFKAFTHVCERHIRLGAPALLVGDVIGEAPNLVPEEHAMLVRMAVGAARGRVPVLAGAGSNATEQAIALSRAVRSAGANAVISVVPYCNKPTQRGIVEHFRHIEASVDIPILVADMPSRTAISLSDETISLLFGLPGVVGLVDGSADILRATRLRSILPRHSRLLSADDATCLGYLAQGGDGCVSVMANVAPGLCHRLFQAHRNGKVADMHRLAAELSRLHRVIGHEPAHVKYALSRLGLMDAGVRLPVVMPSAEHQAEIDAVVSHLIATCPDDMIERHAAECSARKAFAIPEH